MGQLNNAENQSAEGHRTGKVERLISEYELIETGDTLIQRWSGDAGERQSLRDLAEQFNRRLLQAAINEAGIRPREYDIAYVYHLLTADNVSSGARTRIRGRLEQDGVDVEQLTSDFVSHLAVRTYLRHRGATRTEADDDQIAKETQHIQRLRSRVTTVTESKLNQLRTTNRISLGDFRVFTEIQVFCESCETRYDIGELLTQGSCACFTD